jgi:hypothetical protein
MNKTFDFKLLGMRKPQNWIVCPRNEKSPVVVQSDKSIGAFDPVTGVGRLSTKGSYYIHLNPMFSKPFVFPAEFIALALANEYKPGEKIGPGMYVGVQTGS